MLRPSKILMDEIYDPNYQVNPEATLTFNYKQTRDGESPHQLEARKESVQHYFRVRKPVPKRTIFHIRKNKFDENKSLETLAKDALILTELGKFENLSEQDLTPVSIQTAQTERRNNNDDSNLPLSFTETSALIPKLITKGDQLPPMRLRKFGSFPELIASNAASSQTPQPLPEETTAFQTTVQEVKHQDNQQTSEKYTTTPATTAMTTTNKKISLTNDNSHREPTGKNDGETKHLQKVEYNTNKNNDQILSTSTSLPVSKNIPQQKRMRHIIRRFKKIKSAPQDTVTENISNNLPQNTEKYVIPREENTPIVSDDPKTKEKILPPTTEAILTSIATSTSAPNVKTIRNFRRHWLHSRSTTSKPETTRFMPTYATTTNIPDVSDTVTKPHSRRMRFRNKNRKTNRTIRRQHVEPENLPASSSQAMPSSTAVPSTTPSNDYGNSDRIPISTEITTQEKPKGKFSKNNPPPPLPTLSPWYDGYGK
ncbi:probable serine/threonine-protein kinase dyrk2 [Zerene cesonia]|uniref:probable serine/threonine-protein kinase dyrk2 n=1 Tax=Zerene cesonia TaxID=33412 RepID=UPI0018E4F230|nr:probable serine/threonine-protein kinase dyrk2 [Zerene cesonia]